MFDAIALGFAIFALLVSCWSLWYCRRGYLQLKRMNDGQH